MRIFWGSKFILFSFQLCFAVKIALSVTGLYKYVVDIFADYIFYVIYHKVVSKYTFVNVLNQLHSTFLIAKNFIICIVTHATIFRATCSLTLSCWNWGFNHLCFLYLLWFVKLFCLQVNTNLSWSIRVMCDTLRWYGSTCGKIAHFQCWLSISSNCKNKRLSTRREFLRETLNFFTVGKCKKIDFRKF